MERPIRFDADEVTFLQQAVGAIYLGTPTIITITPAILEKLAHVGLDHEENLKAAEGQSMEHPTPVGTTSLQDVLTQLTPMQLEFLQTFLEDYEKNMRNAVNGGWFVYGYDAQVYPIGLFGSEIEALRLALERSGQVVFWPFGEAWDDLQTRLRREREERTNGA